MWVGALIECRPPTSHIAYPSILKCKDLNAIYYAVAKDELRRSWPWYVEGYPCNNCVCLGVCLYKCYSLCTLLKINQSSSTNHPHTKDRRYNNINHHCNMKKLKPVLRVCKVDTKFKGCRAEEGRGGNNYIIMITINSLIIEMCLNTMLIMGVYRKCIPITHEWRSDVGNSIKDKIYINRD